MLRLTLRSGKDGRYLARIVDRGGFPFVLDFGDQRIIEDASQRLLHGFTMWRYGRLVTAPPGDPEMMHLLADFYAGEGLLVFLDEPNWAFREDDRSGDDPGEYPLPDLPPEDDRTELVDAAGDATAGSQVDVERLGSAYDAHEPTHTERVGYRVVDLDEEDAPTEVIDE